MTQDEEAQLAQTIEMFEVITQSQPQDYQSLEILKEAYSKLGRGKDVVYTSKRIAQAYVQMGQLSSAILECETILQRYPDDADVQAARVLGVRDYLHKTGFSKAVLGLSGGIDSAVTAVIGCQALGPENVLCVALPSPYTSQQSIDDASQLAENLGCVEVIGIYCGSIVSPDGSGECDNSSGKSTLEA